MSSSQKSSMPIADRAVVSFDYTLKSDDGEVIDTSEGGEPLTYLHGTGSIVSGLESALDGRVAGDSLQVVVAARDGYGERDDSLVTEATRSQFPKSAKIAVGMQFEANGPQGRQVVTVSSIDGDRIVLDANHPLAGKTLHFDVKIVEVRAATAEELRHGHVHGPGGAHH
jgi:FKBP-type peptidyl-prolyl cis-trans isomerase SlyD